MFHSAAQGGDMCVGRSVCLWLHAKLLEEKMPFAADHDGWVLLNPGPACTSKRVQAALLRGDEP